MPGVRPISVLALLLLLYVQPKLTAQGDEADLEAVTPRVVVQHAAPTYLEISADGRILAGRGGVARQTFYAIDTKARKTVMMLNLPQQIADVAVAPHNDWFAVAGERCVYRVDAASGSYRVLLENTSGQVALNAAGDRLAVLGVIDDQDVNRYSLLRGAGGELGIYDLANENWLARAKTPILIDSDVWFEGDDACGFGRGGRVFNRRASSFRCDVRLSPGTDEPQINQGREVFRGGRGRDGNGGSNGDGYEPKVELAARTETREAAKKQLAAMREQLSCDQLRPQWVFLPLPGSPRQARPVAQGRPPLGGLLQIAPDGQVSMLPLDPIGSRGVYRMGDRLVTIPYDNDHPDTMAVEDLVTGEPLVSFPFRERFPDVSDRTYWMQPLSHGFLVHQPDTLAYYSPQKPAVTWQQPYPRYAGRPFPYGTSEDGKFLYLGASEGPLAKVNSAVTGELVMEVDRGDRPKGYGASCNLNADGSRIACLSFDDRLQIYEVATGKKTYDELLPPKSRYHYVTAAGDHWVLGSDSEGSRIVDARNDKSVPFALSRTFRAAPVTALGRACLLVETRYGQGGIVDVATGELHAEWYLGQYQGTSGPPEGPPRAATLFDGKLLVRRTGHATGIELIDLATLKVVATIHPLRLRGTVGWIAATPDGYWDATPGAEQYVEVVSGLLVLGEERKAARHNPQILKQRIAEASAQ